MGSGFFARPASEAKPYSRFPRPSRAFFIGRNNATWGRIVLFSGRSCAWAIANPRFLKCGFLKIIAFFFGGGVLSPFSLGVFCRWCAQSCLGLGAVLCWVPKFVALCHPRFVGRGAASPSGGCLVAPCRGRACVAHFCAATYRSGLESSPGLCWSSSWFRLNSRGWGAPLLGCRRVLSYVIFFVPYFEIFF